MLIVRNSLSTICNFWFFFGHFLHEKLKMLTLHGNKLILLKITKTKDTGDDEVSAISKFSNMNTIFFFVGALQENNDYLQQPHVTLTCNTPTIDRPWKM